MNPRLPREAPVRAMRRTADAVSDDSKQEEIDARDQKIDQLTKELDETKLRLCVVEQQRNRYKEFLNWIANYNNAIATEIKWITKNLEQAPENGSSTHNTQCPE